MRAEQAADVPDYVELRTASSFSFLRGASHPEELVERAAALGYRRLAITDHDGLYGVVKAHAAGRRLGVQIIVGAEIHLNEAQEHELSLVLLAQNRRGYANLCRMLSAGRMRVGKGGIQLSLEDVAAHHEGLLAIHVGPPSSFLLAQERDIFSDRLSISVERQLSAFDRMRIEAAQSASSRFSVPLVATGGVLMHTRERKPMQDILTCIRLGLRLKEGGRRLLPNTCAYLKSRREMSALFQDMPELLERTVELADTCTFSLDEIKHNFTLELLPDGETGMSYLRKLVYKGAQERYPEGTPHEVQKQIQHELALIDQLDFSGYFLTVWDIVRFARSRGILCQGRGSAANSIVCYALGVTSIDPVRMNLLFERFISAERGEPPDIDVDFEHERREEVMQYVYDKYGREHAAMVANVICYRGKLAYREVGKVFGLGDDQIDRLTKSQGHWSSGQVTDEVLQKAGLDPHSPVVKQVVRWAETFRGFPRHLGLHSGGFVITKEPLIELVPIENATKALRTVIAWDKRDIEVLGLVKVDLLALGMLTAIRRCFHLIEQTYGLRFTLANIPADDTAVYDMICDADTMGTFQIESRAQMQMLPRLRPRTFYDLVVAVAIVRPGPIQGDMVHPYLRRRDGLDPITYPHPALKKILGRTCGVPLFQEQVMKMAVEVAGFTPGQSDELRRAIGWQSQSHIAQMRERLIEGMRKNKLSQEYAERVFRMIQGFGSYGFPESHAASFALISYASCYLKRYYPAEFLAALLNSQPMGFYARHTLVDDARRHGVEVRPPCVFYSEEDSSIEVGDQARQVSWWRRVQKEGTMESRHSPCADAPDTVLPAVRVGLREVRGLRAEEGARIVRARAEAPFSSIAELIHRAQLPRDTAANLAAAGALQKLCPSRREALFEVMGHDRRSPLLRGVRLKDEDVALPKMSSKALMEADYQNVGLSVDVHPMQIMRAQLNLRGVLGYKDIRRAKQGTQVRVGGMVVTRQRPGTASGVVFMTLEDQDGHMNLVVFTPVYERYKELVREEMMLLADGKIERTGRVVNVIVGRLSPMCSQRPPRVVSRDFH